MPADWSVVARGPHDRVWMKLAWQTNQLGQAVAQTNSYVEVGTGLHYLQAGQWVDSQDLIELQPDGSACAVRGPHKVYFAPNLNTAGAITLVTASNRVFKIHLLGLAYYDAASGKAVLLSGLQDSSGELLPPNQIVYKSAFANINADVRYTYTKAGFESDVILLQQPPPPEAYGLSSPTTRLEVWHDFQYPAEPRLTPRPLTGDTADFVDEIADFGDLRFPTGAAYATDATAVRGTNTAAPIRVPNLAREPGLAPVAKTWLRTATGPVLVESVRCAEIQPAWGSLPVVAQMAPPAIPRDRLACLAQLPRSRPRGENASPIHLNSAPYHPQGCVLDYFTISGGNDYDFAITQFGSTYYVPNQAYFNGTLTFEAGVYIKFGTHAWLNTWGPIVCHGSSANVYTYLTSKDDDLFGAQIDGSTHIPTYAADCAIYSDFPRDPAAISGMRIRWAHEGAEIDGNGGSVSDCQFEFCKYGIGAQSYIRIYVDGTMCGVTTPMTPSYSFYGGLMDLCGGYMDTNGLPVIWEYQHFGQIGVDPNADPDGDCLSNLQEYQQGSNPRDWPVITRQPASLMLLTGQTATFSVSTVQGCLNHQWYRSYGHYTIDYAVSGGTSSALTLNNVSFADDWSRFRDAISSAVGGVWTGTATLSVFDTLGWYVRTNYLAHTNGKTINLWSARSTNTPPTSVVWDANGLLYGLTGFTAIAPRNTFEGTVPGTVPVTALTRRHGITRGHGTTGINGFWTNAVGRTVWFCDGNNNIVPMTVTNGYTRCGADCGNPNDYSVVMFTQDLPNSITPMSVMTVDPSYRDANHAYYATSIQHMAINANVPPLNWYGVCGCGPWCDGDSGSPELLPLPDGSLVMIGRCSSGAETWDDIQADMNTLTQAVGLNPNDYQLNRRSP